MKLQLKLLLAFNAAMFGIAGLLEWRYYTAHDSDPHKAVDAHGSLNAASKRRPALNLEELHKSFQNKLQNFTTDTASNGLVALPHAQQAAKPPIPGDGSGHELTNAAIVLICYNRYTIATNCKASCPVNLTHSLVQLHFQCCVHLLVPCCNTTGGFAF